MLDGRRASRISAFVREGDFDDTPAVLEANKGIAFQGSIILGMGFTFDDENAAKGKASSLEEMERLIQKDPRNAERIKPYLGGSEVNTDPEHKHHRYVIDFEDFPLQRDASLKSWVEASDAEQREMLRTGVVSGNYPEPVAADWPDLLDVVERMVKPGRMTDNRDNYRVFWWRYGENRPGLIGGLRDHGEDHCLVILFTSQFPNVARVAKSQVFANSLNVFCSDDNSLLGALQSNVHEIWAKVLGSTMKDDLRYTVTDCFQSFPTVIAREHDNYLVSAVARYLDVRSTVMEQTKLGLTETYNRFHNPLDRKPDIVELRRFHAEMDDAVLRAYSWNDLADMARATSEDGAAPRFLHRTDEPEFAYQERYHWPAWFRDRVLARLLELNRTRAAEEAKSPQNDKIKPSALQLDQQGTLI